MANIVDFAGIKVDNVSMVEATQVAEGYILSKQPHLIFTPNPEIIVKSQKDFELREIINRADLCVADGISMVVVSRILGRPLKERVSGIDLLIILAKLSGQKGYRIFLYGSEPGVAEAAAKNIESKYAAKVVGCADGYQGDDSAVINKIKELKPDMLFVGLGAGKQERWLNHHLKELNVPLTMVIGGSLDVISGRKKRAPVWTQKLYIEWLYRLVTEPQRWKRQLALPQFLWLMLKPRQ